MSNQSNGLRFDVYERVHLPDDVAAIDELEEIELVPRIQVIDQGDQAVLKGQLLLSGVYRGQNAISGPLTLEHWIPVEISLPMNRVSRLDDISIEIDNFDVDLISARTLNITGVLSLRGIAVEPVEEQSGQPWEEEPFTATHEREAALQQGDIGQSGHGGQPFGAGEFGNAEQAGDGAESQGWYQSLQHQQLREGQAEHYWAQQQQQELAGQASQDWLQQQTQQQDWLQQQAQQQEWSQQGRVPQQFQIEQDEQGYIADATSVEPADDSQREITIASQQAGNDGWLHWSALAESGQSAQKQQPSSQQSTEFQQQEQPWITDAGYSAESDAAVDRPEDEALASSVEPPVVDAVAAGPGEEDGIRQEPDAVTLDVIDEGAAQEVRKVQEVQIAFAGKSPSGGGEGKADVGFRSILQSSQREQAAREAAEQHIQEQQAQQEGARTNAIEEEIEWKKLFLSKAEDNEFRKIRMCIVQREETLEQIAIRYSLNPRELLNHNGLHESAIEEGQLLYIP